MDQQPVIQPPQEKPVAAQPEATTPQFATQPKKGSPWLIVTVIIILLLALAGGGYWYLNYYQKPSENNNLISDQLEPTPTPTPEATPTIDPAVQATIEKGWQAAQALKQAAENGDNLAFQQLFAVKPKECDTKSDACAQTMAQTATVLAKLELTNFVNGWEGENEVVIQTRAMQNATDTALSSEVITLYFTKNKSGGLDSMGIDDHTYTSTITLGKTRADAAADLELQMKDSDMDGLTDLEETCAGSYVTDASCTKTDPTNRDTDGNGYWDPIDLFWNRLTSKQTASSASADPDIERVKAILPEVKQAMIKGDKSLIAKYSTKATADMINSDSVTQYPVSEFTINSVRKSGSQILVNITDGTDTFDWVFVKEDSDWKFDLKGSLELLAPQ